MSKTLLALLLLLGCAPLWALPQHSPVPGGVAVIKLGQSAGAQRPVASYRGEKVLTVKEGGQWLAIVGIPLSAKPGSHRVDVALGADRRTIAFEVKDKKYATQKLTLQNKRMVEPTAEDLKRIEREQVLISAALKHWSESDDVTLEFAVPADGPRSSSFGLRRFFNGQARNPHSGMDIAAPQGAPISAPAPGKVVEAGDFFFNGNSVFIDHGQGLVTMYCHMESVQVKTGQQVNTGDAIGTVGMTGRATGPHLHWTVSLNNARVDPALFINQAPGERQDDHAGE